MRKNGPCSETHFPVQQKDGSVLERFQPKTSPPWTENKKITNNRKGGRVVEGTALEKRHTGNGIESSNLSLSAKIGNQFSLQRK